MGKWQYSWEVEYYGEGLIIRRVVIKAKDKKSALKKLREDYPHIVSIKSCRRAITW